MEKDAYYFPHFCNAKSDRKILRVRKELGLEGYAIFFMLLETLREQADLKYPVQDIDLLADEFGTSEQKVRTVITNYGLFDLDEDEMFFSPRLLLYLEPYFQMKEQRKINGKKGAEKRWHSKAIAEPSQSHSVAIANDSKVKESKVKESKGEMHALPNGQSVPINLTTHQSLVDEYGIDVIESYYEKILDYSASKGKKYSDYSATCRNWMKRDIDQGKGPTKKHVAKRCPSCDAIWTNSGCQTCFLTPEEINDKDAISRRQADHKERTTW